MGMIIAIIIFAVPFAAGMVLAFRVVYSIGRDCGIRDAMDDWWQNRFNEGYVAGNRAGIDAGYQKAIDRLTEGQVEGK